MDTTYNGWTNYETWLLNLHISNDPTLDYEAQDITRQAGSAYDVAHDLERSIRTWIDDETETKHPTAINMLISDMIGAALSEVNWLEIAEHYYEDAHADDPESIDD